MKQFNDELNKDMKSYDKIEILNNQKMTQLTLSNKTDTHVE